ncbi:unnamed protein product [Adineta steineri]|uniref:Glycosyltransferase family 28 N-terminal domain-containing protein n=2 Tax=Adineta steineri TaxID=433720 RepID=A0A814X5S8_9BILA|nr:unnamed protein product [Adineta steineri]CAF3609996.1 unnamed protein product [Adineta steineri]
MVDKKGQMEIMEAHKNDLTNIDFNNDWKCYCQLASEEIDQESMIAVVHNIVTDPCWSSINLPHIKKFEEINLHKWLYYKKFDWISIDNQIQQQIQLVFGPNINLNDSSVSSNITATIWLNNTKIFSGSFMSLTNPIELPSKLLHNENILVICCSNSILSRHARLILHGKIICATGQVNVSEEFSSRSKTQEQNENEIMDYTISLDDTNGRIGVLFKSKRKYKTPLKSISSSPQFVPYEQNERQINENKEELKDDLLIPRLAILILTVGTRGDVQPFIALGQALRAYGHRVRLATHETFRSFVRGNGLEFYPLAGDPADLISFMVKNAGIIPSMSSIIAGDVGKKRRSLADILASTWQACIANDDETDMPFTAEAIIANPPSFGHIHCAEKLQIPLHIMFTMPWTTTAAFPHPCSNIDNSTGSRKLINRYSYDLIDTLTWTGLRDIINNFRKKTLGLSTLNTSQAINMLNDERVPHTYCWSPSLVSKPDDWGAHINVSGFFFLDLGTAYTNPPQDLLDFLQLNDDKSKLSLPIYIGFGSIAGHDSRRILKVVIDAVNLTGYRVLLSGLATDTDHLPSNIFKIGNVPHDWLFQHVSAVCHHGGAGTTAAGLRAGKPTIIVPFFGDQFFWGAVIAKCGAGPQPVPGKSITTDQLIQAFHFVHKPMTCVAAESLRGSILKEDGCAAAVRAFHANLPLTRMHSDLEPTFAACYRSDKYNIQISRPVAQVLVSSNILEESQLRPHVTREWHVKHDNHTHIIMHGLWEHSHKAISTMFVDTTIELKRTSSIQNINKRTTLGGAGTVAKGVGLGIGHLTIGSLALYGELTDILDHLPYLYDPYSNSKSRPVVIDFKSGAKAAGLTLWTGWKEGITGMITHPCAGYKRHGILGGAAGSVIASVNIWMKPGLSTLSSITWLSRGVYANATNVLDNYKKEGRRISPNVFNVTSSLSTANNEEIQNENDKEVSFIARTAANISGFHPKICQNIIDEFEKIKAEHEQHMNSLRRKKKNPISFPRIIKNKRSSSVDNRIDLSRKVKY